ncbi:MAG: phage holin family protein [Nitrospiraceae bacterium]|nr:MAG: phage holin family protein [Nitrospiraceae bacterium]
MEILKRWLISGVSLFAAAWIVPGISTEGDSLTVYLVMAIILGLINLTVKPVLTLLSLPITVLTLGLFMLVVNAIMLWLASAIAVKLFNLGFYVDGFWSAFLGALIVSVVSMILSSFVRD